MIRPDVLLNSYRRMYTVRRFEERLMELKRDGEIPGSIHLCIGQEAIPVGASAALRPDDAVTATYRGHGWAIARGAPLVEMFAEIMGRDSTLNGGRAGSAYLSDPSNNFLGENSIVAAGMPIALGAAVGFWQQGSDRVSLVTVGEGATNQGAAHETLNFAAAWSLPLVVVVENNLYSEMMPWREMVGIEQIADRAPAYGMPGKTIDGNNPFAVHAAIQAAVRRARRGDGPTLVECMTERLVGHFSGDAQAYRPTGEIADAREREPLVRLERRPDWDSDVAATADEIAGEIDGDIERAVTAARQRSEPDPASARDHVHV